MIKNLYSKKVVVVGGNDISKQLIENIQGSSKKVTVSGFFEDADTNYSSLSIPKLGNINQSISYALKNKISEIYCTLAPENHQYIYALAAESESNFIRFRYVPNLGSLVDRKMHLDFSTDTPILKARPEPLEKSGNRIYKRIFDIVFSSAVILLVLSWLLPLISLLIKIDSRGPVFFKQLRSGKKNKPFLCYKFRSLKVNDQANQIQVTKEDERFTRLGKFLRKTNLDELPQFFNVLLGDMSVIGPRPHMLKHTEEFSSILNHYMLRHYVKPGVTGWAQVNGYRGQINEQEDLSKRVEYDIWYINNWNILLEFKIILMTITSTIKGDKNAF